MLKKILISVVSLVFIGFIGMLFIPGKIATDIFQNSFSTYSKFYDFHQAHISNMSRIESYRNSYNEAKTDDERSRTKVELNAVQQTCRELVAKYNADSSKIQMDMFKSKNLPYRLDVASCN